MKRNDRISVAAMRVLGWIGGKTGKIGQEMKMR